MTDKHEVESRIEAAEDELCKAKEALKKLNQGTLLKQEFSGLLRAMYIPENAIEITDESEPYRLTGLIKNGYWIFGDKIPHSFYDRFTVQIHATNNPREIEFKLHPNTK